MSPLQEADSHLGITGAGIVNSPNLIALALVCGACLFLAMGCFFGLILVFEDLEEFPYQQQGPTEAPYRNLSEVPPSQWLLLLFAFFALPAGVLAATGILLFWFVGSSRLGRRAQGAWGRILAGRITGLLLLTMSLLTLLLLLPTAAMASVVISFSEGKEPSTSPQHPMLILASATALGVTVPLAFGSGLLGLAHLEAKAIQKRSPLPAESIQHRRHLQRWNLRWERISILLVCGALLALACVGLEVFNKVVLEVMTPEAHRSPELQLALSAESYFGSTLLYCIPAGAFMFLAVGIRWFLIRPKSWVSQAQD